MTGSSNPMRLEFVCLFVRLFFLFSAFLATEGLRM